MNYAVKLFSNVAVSEKPLGIPDGWPAEVCELGESSTLPEGAGWLLMTQEEFDTHKSLNQADYNTWYTGVATVGATNTFVNNRIKCAMDFGKQLMVEYGTRNVLAGLTTQQVRDIADKLAKLQSLLLSGSMYAALEELNVIQIDTVITQEAIDEVKVKINHFLGMS